MDWDDFQYDEPATGELDLTEVKARDSLRLFFEANDSDVFFANQLAVRSEDEFFHWITYRAITDLIGEGLVRTETRQLRTGSPIKLLWNRGYSTTSAMLRE